MGSWGRLWHWFDDRLGVSEALKPIVRHVVPPGTGWFYTLGTAVLTAFVIQAVTGITLATLFVPTTGSAYQSIQYISNQVTLGNLLRGLHYFGSSAMVVLLTAHMIRVFLTGSYKFPREMNWLTGSVLLLTTVALTFTGQLLRWDSSARGSLLVASEEAGRFPFIGTGLAHFILAGDTINGLTISRIFALHAFWLPALLIADLSIHLWLVLHNGISEPPVAGQVVDPKTYRQKYHAYLRRQGRRFWPDVAWRDVVVDLSVISIVFVLAIVFGPKVLSQPPDPTLVHIIPRPDWYFEWYFAFQAIVPDAIENYLVVLLPTSIVATLILVPLVANRGERSPLRRPWAIGVVVLGLLTIASLTIVGLRAPWTPNFNAQLPPAQTLNLTSMNGQVLTGAQLFNQHGCIYCHKVEGYGGDRGPNLTIVSQRLPEGLIKTRIIQGYGHMPAFQSILNSDQVDAIVAFLESLPTGPSSAQTGK